MILFICVSTTSLSFDDRTLENISELEQALVDSLKTEQQKWWTDNRQKIFDTVVNAEFGNEEQPEQSEDIDNFSESLNPTQHELWSKLQRQANRIIRKFVASQGMYYPVTQFQRAAAAACGGGCVTSSQCASWAGNTDCRSTWFTCGWI
mgnify:FL=1